MEAFFALLLILGLVSFILGVLDFRALGVRFISLGLAFWITVPLIHQLQAL